MHKDPHTFRIGPEAGVEEVMRDLYVRDVCLIKLETEPSRGKNGGEGKVKLAVCETVLIKAIGQ